MAKATAVGFHWVAGRLAMELAEHPQCPPVAGCPYPHIKRGSDACKGKRSCCWLIWGITEAGGEVEVDE